MRGSRSNDQEIKGLGFVPQEDRMPGDIDIRDLVQNYRCIFLPAQNRSYRPGDIGWRQACRGDLIQEGLEEMIVMTVNNPDIGVNASQLPGSEKAAETGAKDYDSRHMSSLSNIRRKSPVKL